MQKCLVVILCIFVIVVQSGVVWRVVEIAQGTLRGHLDPDGGLYVFYNIPYATAPTGPNKFKAPLPPPVFESPFDAIDRRIICPQPGGMMNMREDCLVANVFVPVTTTADSRIPVLVIIHGGAYQYGYGEQEKFRELAKTKKIIVVTFNYRLGVHGFLCLGTEGAPGNAGLKDQVALLRWVNTNIRNFGGDPDDVTLAACSAGSGSVDFLTLSTITKGLFKKAIMESGVSTGAVGVQIDPINNAKTYAKLLGFNGDDWSSLEEFYKTATFQQLLSHQDVITNNQEAILFGPCVESDIGQERVVFNAPFSIIKQGNYTKIPLMYGFTNMDGAMRLPSLNAWKNRMNEKFSDFLPAELYFESEDVKEEIARRVKHLYFGDEPVSQDNIQKYITYFTDVLFRYPMLRSLSTRVEALGDTIYLFEYSFVDEQTEVFPNTNIQGAGYCQPFIAVMDEDVTDRTEEYKKMKQTLREYWHSFILNGVPSSSDSDLPTWKPAGARRSPRMSLGPVIELKNDNVLDGRAAFWDEIYEKHFSPPVGYTPKRRTTKRPTNIQTTRATSNPITSAPNTVTSNPITSAPNTVTSNPITSAPNTVTYNPGTSTTINTGGLNPITTKRTTTYWTTASSNNTYWTTVSSNNTYSTSATWTTTNTTNSTTTEWTTIYYPSINVSTPSPGSGVGDSAVISNFMFLVVLLSLYFNCQ